jgi:dihydroorotate dehydrogenase (NAD+) catalytic subunit
MVQVILAESAEGAWLGLRGGRDGLSVDLAGLRLCNPTVLASGILGYSAESVERIVEGGAGAIVSKSVGLVGRRGYANPTVVQLRFGLVNALGLPNSGVDLFVGEVRRVKAVLGVPFFVSVYGFSAEEYACVAERAAVAGADGVELNVSCPHVGGTGCEIGQDPDVLADVVRRVKASVDKPVFVKLSPNVSRVGDLAEAAVGAGADGLVAVNTVRAMVIDVETRMPVLSNRVGGLSGPAIKPIAVRCVYDVFDRVKVPVVGCGGVSGWRDAVEFLLAGASAVQIGTAVASKGPDVFRSVARGIGRYLRRKGFNRVGEIVGLAHRR